MNIVHKQFSFGLPSSDAFTGVKKAIRPIIMRCFDENVALEMGLSLETIPKYKIFSVVFDREFFLKRSIKRDDLDFNHVWDSATARVLNHFTVRATLHQVMLKQARKIDEVTSELTISQEWGVEFEAEIQRLVSTIDEPHTYLLEAEQKGKAVWKDCYYRYNLKLHDRIYEINPFDPRTLFLSVYSTEHPVAKEYVEAHRQDFLDGKRVHPHSYSYTELMARIQAADKETDRNGISTQKVLQAFIQDAARLDGLAHPSLTDVQQTLNIYLT